ncbi:MAG: DUF4124 domain-containing protein [Betaproteobacteria bacterium]
MRCLAYLLLTCFSLAAQAQIYRWVDANGRVNFSNAAPPQGVKSTVVDADAKEAPAVPDSQECYTIRCQGERMEERQRRREAEDARMATDRAALAPKPVRGLEFRKYISLQRGMSEGELLGIAGEPDLKADQGVAIAEPAYVQGTRNAVVATRTGLVMKTYTYLPTPGDPFTTTITLVGGRVSELERVRKF